MRQVRFRTLGCYPLTGAVESEADTVEEIVAEMLADDDVRTPGPSDRPRRGRSSMEKKKQEGYFLRTLRFRRIDAWLAQQERKELLRFITCGSVDDGKSTLIGRLLYDTKQIFDDQLAALEATASASARRAMAIDFALLVDGLSAEREQGITIDVAYRFFSTAKRKFIVADTPGHEQYTRNMVTGASTADLAVLLVDARKGVLTQTRRHCGSRALIGIRHVRAGGQQDGPGRLRPGACSTRSWRTIACSPPRSGSSDGSRSRCRRWRRQCAAGAATMPWYDGPEPARTSREGGRWAAGRCGQGRSGMPVQWVNRPDQISAVSAGRSPGRSPGSPTCGCCPPDDADRADRHRRRRDLERSGAGQSVTLTFTMKWIARAAT